MEELQSSQNYIFRLHPSNLFLPSLFFAWLTKEALAPLILGSIFDPWFLLLIGISPFLFVVFRNKLTQVVVNEKTLKICFTGPVSSALKTIILANVSTVLVHQNPIQKLFGSGNISIQMGWNDPLIIRDISNIQDLTDLLTKHIDKD